MTKISTFITHKMAESMADCQDAYAIHAGNRAVAIADGVSESLFPKVWAEILTASFVSDGAFRLDADEKVARARAQWRRFFVDRVESRMAEDSPLSWYLERCLAEEKSAGSTLVGIRATDGGVDYEALGDSCLVAVRDGCIESLITSMPDGEAFGNQPDYIDSHPAHGMRGTPRTGALAMSPGDKLFLATDALAERFDAERAAPDRGRSFVEAIDRLRTACDFEQFVHALRRDGMADDDTTLVCIEWEHSPDFHIAGRAPEKVKPRKKGKRHARRKN
ncbi:MAG: protein phosphatase 2C domain-containing protein [Tannerella sp.]|jgi:hypothetical protein|nr:protein phosphatase 2C domain-containing protein [Tannerella sp.]